TGKSGRALEDLVEASAAKVQVADDQRCPALCEDLGAARYWAVLAVRPHDASIAHPPSVVKSRFLTLRLRFTVVEYGRRKEDTMMTPATTEVGSKEPAVVEIDGFRGRLISANNSDYDTAR